MACVTTVLSDEVIGGLETARKQCAPTSPVGALSGAVLGRDWKRLGPRPPTFSFRGLRQLAPLASLCVCLPASTEDWEPGCGANLSLGMVAREGTSVQTSGSVGRAGQGLSHASCDGTANNHGWWPQAEP